MSEYVINRHLILAQKRRKRKFNLWILKNGVKCLLGMAAMFGFAILVSLVAGLIT